MTALKVESIVYKETRYSAFALADPSRAIWRQREEGVVMGGHDPQPTLLESPDIENTYDKFMNEPTTLDRFSNVIMLPHQWLLGLEFKGPNFDIKYPAGSLLVKPSGVYELMARTPSYNSETVHHQIDRRLGPPDEAYGILSSTGLVKDPPFRVHNSMEMR